MSSVKFLKFGSQSIAKVGSNVMGYNSFSPTNITNNVIWLNNDPSTMTLSTNRVSQWSDGSGNGHHFIQAISLNQPLYTPNVQNGQGGVYWDNNNFNFLDCTLSQTYTQAFEIFIVWNVDSNSTRSYPYVYDSINATNRVALYWFGNNIGALSPTVVSNAYPKTRPFNLMVSDTIYNGANTKLYENNILKATKNTGTNSLSSLRLGMASYSPNDTNSRMSGYICEVIVYSRELISGERDLVNNYLINKYAL